jgi:hypothetical protein
MSLNFEKEKQAMSEGKKVQILKPNWQLPAPISQRALQDLTKENWRNPDQLVGKKLVVARFEVHSDEGIGFKSCRICFSRTRVLSIIEDEFRWQAKVGSRKEIRNPWIPTEESIGFYVFSGQQGDHCWTADYYGDQLDMIERWARTDHRDGDYSSNLIFALL